MRRGLPRARARILCDGVGCRAEVIATGETLADANEHLKAALADAGWVVGDLDETLAQAERMIEERLEAVRHCADRSEGAGSSMQRVDVERMDLCPTCQAKTRAVA